MATIIDYRCKQCNHKVSASPEGYSTFVQQTLYYFRCEECKEIVTLTGEELVEQRGVLSCPNCHDIGTLSTWNPIEGCCPKCGGEMEQDPDGGIVMVD